MKKDTKSFILAFSVICIGYILIAALISCIPADYYDSPSGARLYLSILFFIFLAIFVIIRGINGTRGYYKKNKNDKL